MGKEFILAEKPSVAKDIANALGGMPKNADGFFENARVIVGNARGHLVELDVPEAKGKSRISDLPIIPPNGFKLKPVDGDRDLAALLQRIAKTLARPDVTTIVNACDAAREGELIFRYMYYYLGCKKPMKRMWLQTMTPKGILAGYEGMRDGKEFDTLFNAGQSRSEADWLIGINGTRALTDLASRRAGHREDNAAGRVMTPTLAILVHREDEILKFKPKSFWEVHATFKVKAGEYEGRWINPNPGAAAEGEDNRFRTFDKAIAESVVKKCSGVAPSSISEETKPESKSPPRLFDLTTLQRQANVRFGFSAKHTLTIAQALYEKYKATTYPRTDASALPEDYVETAKGVLRSFAGTSLAAFAGKALDSGWVKPVKRIFDNSKISDHFAIIPTGEQPSGLSPDEAKIYDMVSRRFIAVFYPNAEYQQTTRLTVVAGESFRSAGRVLVEPGWLAVYGQDVESKNKEKEEPALTKIEQGETAATTAVKLKPMETKAPERYTEDKLLAAMEGAGKFVDDEEAREAMKERGMGTPATRAATIEKLLDDGSASKKPKEPFAIRRGKLLVPQKKGIDQIHLLEEIGLEQIASPQLTGEWEHKLGLIEKGKLRRADFMAEVADTTRKIITAVAKQAEGLPPLPQGGGQGTGTPMKNPCPKCGSQMLARDMIYACSNDQKCDFKIWATIAKRKVTQSEAEQLLKSRKTGELKGFVNKSGAKFDAILELAPDGSVKFSFTERKRA